MNWEYVTAQVIRVPESVMYVPLCLCTCKLPTGEPHVANKNRRKALSLTIRYGYLTAGDFAVLYVQPPPSSTKRWVLSTASLATEAPRWTADWSVSLLGWNCAMSCFLNSVSPALFKQTVFMMGEMPYFTGNQIQDKEQIVLDTWRESKNQL